MKTKMGNKCASWEVIQHEMLIHIMNTQSPVCLGRDNLAGSFHVVLIQAGISQVTASSDTREREEDEKRLSGRLLTILMKRGESSPSGDVFTEAARTERWSPNHRCVAMHPELWIWYYNLY